MSAGPRSVQDQSKMAAKLTPIEDADPIVICDEEVARMGVHVEAPRLQQHGEVGCQCDGTDPPQLPAESESSTLLRMSME